MAENEELKTEGTAEENEAVNTEAEETVEEKVEGTVEDVEEEVSEEEADPEGGDAEPEKEKKSFFKKKEKKKDERDEKIDALTDQYKRLMAEFDNYRKRTEKEKAAMYDMGVSKTIEKLLPVVDNFERGLASVPEGDRETPTYTGMDMIYKQTVKMLTDMGVEPIDAVGKEFDPNLHNAVMQVENDELESGTVAQELQKGYTYKGTVIRFSMVSVVM